jgi:hypothetical protein
MQLNCATHYMLIHDQKQENDADWCPLSSEIVWVFLHQWKMRQNTQKSGLLKNRGKSHIFLTCPLPFGGECANLRLRNRKFLLSGGHKDF